MYTLHPMEKEYTHYSITHNTQSRIDYVFMNSWDLHKADNCKIVVTDISDHSAMIHDTEEISPTILWDTLKAVIRGKLQINL